jgi:DNA-directed RNA polymerase subunit RPC12/RpoP
MIIQNGGKKLAFGIESRICPDCRKLYRCGVHEIKESSIHYYDEYTLYCLKCGRIVSKEKIYKGSTISGTGITECPFCGRRSNNHERTPQELLPNPATSKQDFLFEFLRK